MSQDKENKPAAEGSNAYRRRYNTIRPHSLPASITIITTTPEGNEQKTQYREVRWPRAGATSGNAGPRDSATSGNAGLRYGENPEQGAALYAPVGARTLEVSGGKLLQSGKHLSKTNICDVDTALHILARSRKQACAVIMKHNNPSAAAVDSTMHAALTRAYNADTLSAFGSVVVVNREVDIACAELLTGQFFEMIAAPRYTLDALKQLQTRKNLRVMQLDGIDNPETDTPAPAAPAALDIRTLRDGSLCIQEPYTSRMLHTDDFEPARTTHDGTEYRSTAAPTAQQRADLLFAWHIVEALWSNAAVYVKDGVTVGIGCGAVDRVGAVHIATEKAYAAAARSDTAEHAGKPAPAPASTANPLAGSVLVSDGFFPFTDAIEPPVAAGVAAIAAPGGALRDWEIIEYCNARNTPLLFSKQRAFRH